MPVAVKLNIRLYDSACNKIGRLVDLVNRCVLLCYMVRVTWCNMNSAASDAVVLVHILHEDILNPCLRAIVVSHSGCIEEFRPNPRSHSCCKYFFEKY